MPPARAASRAPPFDAHAGRGPAARGDQRAQERARGVSGAGGFVWHEQPRPAFGTRTQARSPAPYVFRFGFGFGFGFVPVAATCTSCATSWRTRTRRSSARPTRRRCSPSSQRCTGSSSSPASVCMRSTGTHTRVCAWVCARLRSNARGPQPRPAAPRTPRPRRPRKATCYAHGTRVLASPVTRPSVFFPCLSLYGDRLSGERPCTCPRAPMCPITNPQSHFSCCRRCVAVRGLAVRGGRGHHQECVHRQARGAQGQVRGCGAEVRA